MVQVRVNEGVLEGEEIQNQYGGKYFSFKGIPYAQPPVGDLRFKAPQPVQPWTGIRSAIEYGPVCHQFDVLNTDQDNMSEDCLYLNVFTPEIKASNLRPVMVWIHGGSFICESGNDDYYGPEFLIRHGIVLVTLNYRLGTFGFLCLHTADIPGNAGMKDQVEGIRWVKNNIHSFGGDPANITIFGNSAGGACISYHLISPMSKGLFHRAIAQSGAAACWWSEDFESRDKSLLLAKQLGCFSEDDKNVYEFFKKQPASALIITKLQVWKSQKSYEIPFGVADEKDFGQERFFYGNVTDALRNGVHEEVEIMTGYNKDEGIMALAAAFPENLMNEAKYFNDFFVPRWIKSGCVLSEHFKVGRKIRQFYANGEKVSEEGVIRFLNMDFFVYGVILSGKFYARRNKVYFYKFNCVSERNVYGQALGLSEFIRNKSVVCHGDDLAYLFPVKSLTGKVEPESLKMIDMTTKLWTNFAKYGNPTPDNSLGVQWRPYTLENQEYLEIGNINVMDKIPEKEELEFWENIFKEYLPQYTL